MATLEYLDSGGEVIRFNLVPWDALNRWLSKLNGTHWISDLLPPGLNRGNVIEELEERRKRPRNYLKEGAIKLLVGDRGYAQDWREYENEHGYTHMEELLIYQPSDWRKQAREYFYVFKYALDRESENVEKRTHTVTVEYEEDDGVMVSTGVPLVLPSPVLVTLFHPEMSKASRYEPLNFLLSYGVEKPILKSSESFKPKVWKEIKQQVLAELSPLDYFFAFQENVELYDFDTLQGIAKKTGFLRMPLICELDFSKIIGQRLAKHMIRKEVVNWMWNRSKKGELCHNRSPLSLIFAGPSGNGKTELAEVLAKLLNKPSEDDAFHKVDCGKLSDANELFGMAGYYQGSMQGSALNNYILRMSQEPEKVGVVLLDEIEKAERKVIHALYQVLDKGEWTNKKLVEEEGPQTSVVSCENIIFVMTTNSADRFILSKATSMEELYTAPAKNKVQHNPSKTLGEHGKALDSQVRRQLRNLHPFTDAFMGRVGSVIPFLPLSGGDPKKHMLLGEMMTIAKYSIERDLDNMRRGGMMGITPTVTTMEKDKMAKIIVAAAIPAAGVRSIQKGVKDELDKELLHDRLVKRGGIERGAAVNYRCDEYKKAIAYRVVDKEDLSDEDNQMDVATLENIIEDSNMLG